MNSYVSFLTKVLPVYEHIGDGTLSSFLLKVILNLGAICNLEIEHCIDMILLSPSMFTNLVKLDIFDIHIFLME